MTIRYNSAELVIPLKHEREKMMNQATLRNSSWVLFGAAFILCLFSGLAFSADQEEVHRALRLFDEEGRANASDAVKAWLKVMTVMLLSSLLFVWKRVEARWIAGGVILMLLFSRLIVPTFEIPFLEGLASLTHVILWSPGLYFLLSRRIFLKELSIYSVWAGLMTLVILISFFFDIPDSIVYLIHILS